ncbi:phosphatase PAP2 family protein [Lapidilactobacillus bayanensis]|uniref:phosphatase PAP2 family protein n=1 Tax=Lapidilactobacillus bayanensis TaxID=2485998 RepID=UPI000F7B7FF8|nr:phosphatase PAP2 family protein [Lapidilactobacillus bayanensis]
MKKHDALLVSLVILCYIIFSGFYWGVTQHATWIHQYDNLIYGWLKPLHPNSTPFFTLYTKIGNPAVISTITLIVILVLIAIKHWRWSVFLTINMIIGNLINHLVKSIVQRPRPSLPHLVVETGYSFPSGHATAAVMFFGSLILIGHYLIKQRSWHHLWITLMLLMLLLLGISRLYVQVHYPSDVTAGFLLALGNLTVHWLIAVKTYLKPELSDQ